MKCKFCGADLNNYNGKCDFCGNFQQGYPNTYSNNMTIKNKKKYNNKVLIICISFLVIIAFILFFILILTKSTKYKFEGNWICSNGDIKLEIDSKDFIFDSSDVKIVATYEIEYDELMENSLGNYYKYGLILKSTNREVNGKKYTDLYTTKYEINIDVDNEDELLMINSLTYNMYQCSREK